MSDAIADLYVLLTANTTGFTGPLEAAAAAAEAATARIMESVAQANAAIADLGASTEATAAKITAAEDETAAAVEGASTKVRAASDQIIATNDSMSAAMKVTIDELNAQYTALGLKAGATADEIAAADEKIASGWAATADSVKVSTASIEASMDHMAAQTKLAGAEMEAQDVKTAAATETMAAKTDASASIMAGSFGKAALGVGAAAGIVIAKSVQMADQFQTQMTRLYTAAGAPKAVVQGATGEILAMGTQLGFTGTQMAEALYHPVSAGLSLATSLKVVDAAAKEAKISGASLDDTTYSLSSVMKAFNLSTADATPTMATLNAIVGEGDMRFQDFNQSVKNWAPTAAQMGISVSSMGSGLAYLTDRGNSATVASTRLTMGISMMSTPSAKATKMLEGLGLASTDVKASSAAMESAMKKAGITQNQLAADLKQPDGLFVALNDLKTSLEKAGVSGTEADSVLSKIFGGGRSDKAIMSLMQNLDGLKQKYDAITTDSTPQKFQQNWQDASNTFKVQMDRVKSGIDNVGISIGDNLLPPLTAVAKVFADFLGFLVQNQGVVTALSYALGTVLAVAVGALTVKLVAMVVKPTLKLAGAAAKFLEWVGTRLMGGKKVADAALADAEVEQSAQEQVAASMQAAADSMQAAADRISGAFSAQAEAVQGATTRIEESEQQLVVVAEETSVKVNAALESEVTAAATAATEISASYGEIAAAAEGSSARVVAADATAGAANEGEAATAGAGAVGAAGKKGIGGKLMKGAGTLLMVGMGAQMADSMIPQNTPAQNQAAQNPLGSVGGYTAHDRNELSGISAAISNPSNALDDLKKQFAAFPAEFASSPIATFFKGFGKTVSGLMGNAGTWLTKTGGDMWHGFWDKGVVPVWNTTVKWLKDLPKNIQNFLATAKTWLVKHGKELWTGFWDNGVVVKFNDTVKWFKDLPKNVKNFLATAKTWLVTHGKELWTGFWDDGVIVKFNDTVQWFKDLPGKIKNWLSGAGTWLTDAGHNVMVGFYNGLVGMWKDVQNFVGSIGSWIAAHKGPIEYDRQLLVPHGNAIMDGLHDGLQQGHERVKTMVAGIAGSLAGQFGQANLVGTVALNASASGVSIGSAAALAPTSTTGGVLAGLATQAGQQGGQTVINHITVQGSVVTERELAEAITEHQLLHNSRNPSNGASYNGFR